MDFYWKDVEGRSLEDRFRGWAGASRAGRGLSELREAAGLLVLTQPRVFISHKQADVTEALRAEQIASAAGFNTWLDVLDPTLASGAAPPQAVAAIIEMALIHCTHVLAVMTDNTASSRWVPYEYGRVKDDQLVSDQAACWKITKRKLPEYCELNPILKSERDMRMYFQAERARYP